MSLARPQRTHRVPSFVLARTAALAAVFICSAVAHAAPRATAPKQGTPQALARGVSWTTREIMACLLYTSDAADE